MAIRQKDIANIEEVFSLFNAQKKGRDATKENVIDSNEVVKKYGGYMCTSYPTKKKPAETTASNYKAGYGTSKFKASTGTALTSNYKAGICTAVSNNYKASTGTVVTNNYTAGGSTGISTGGRVNEHYNYNSKYQYQYQNQDAYHFRNQQRTTMVD